MSLVCACRKTAPAGAIEIFNLWKGVEHYPQNRVRMQHQDLSLRIIIAFDPTGKLPLSLHKPALLHDAESHIGRSGRVRRKVRRACRLRRNKTRRGRWQLQLQQLPAAASTWAMPAAKRRGRTTFRGRSLIRFSLRYEYHKSPPVEIFPGLRRKHFSSLWRDRRITQSEPADWRKWIPVRIRTTMLSKDSSEKQLPSFSPAVRQSDANSSVSTRRKFRSAEQ